MLALARQRPDETVAKARDPVADLAAKLEPSIRRAVLRALGALQGRTSLAALERAIAAGDVEAVLALLDIDPADFNEVRDALREAMVAGAGVAAPAVARARSFAGNTIRVRFDLLNPATIQAAQQYEYRLVRQINEATRAGIRTVVTDGLRAGTNPRQVAVQVKQLVGLTDRQTKAVARFRAELEGFHLRDSAKGWNLGGKISRAAGGAQVYAIGPDGQVLDGIRERRLRDFRFDGRLMRAMETGKALTKEQIDQMVEAYARKYRGYRAQTIARTEALRASNLGAYEQWRQAAEAGLIDGSLVRRKWLVASDERTCPTCSVIPGMNQKGVGLEGLFNTPLGAVKLPPIHPDCRCTTVVRVIEPEQALEGW